MIDKLTGPKAEGGDWIRAGRLRENSASGVKR